MPPLVQYAELSFEERLGLLVAIWIATEEANMQALINYLGLD